MDDSVTRHPAVRVTTEPDAKRRRRRSQIDPPSVQLTFDDPVRMAPKEPSTVRDEATLRKPRFSKAKPAAPGLTERPLKHSARANPLADMSLRELLSVADADVASDDPDRHLSRDEAAELLGIPAKTVENLARAGRLPSVLVGRRRVYRRSALLARVLEAEKTGLGI